MSPGRSGGKGVSGSCSPVASGLRACQPRGRQTEWAPASRLSA